ncbi:MAG: TolC family protein [Alphaproteobacteria bacterium]|nr:TolC family protein [Alphaproteobacteria bacterium]
MNGINQFFLAVFALCSVALQSVASAETLQDSLISAMKEHPSVEVAEAGYMSALQDERRAFSGYFPEVNVSGAFGRVYQDNATSRGLDVVRGAGYSGYGEGNITMRQHLFDGFKTTRKIDAAEAAALKKNLDILEVKNDLVFRVARSYLDLLRVGESIALLQEQRDKITEYEQKILSLVKEGLSDEVEGQQARDVRMIVDGVIAEYKGQFLSAKSKYTELTGQAAKGGFVVPESLAYYVSENIEDEITLANDYHYSVLIADADILAAESQMLAAKSEYYPDMDGEVSFAKTDKRDLIGGESKDVKALVRMNWNFSMGGKKAANTKGLTYKYEAAKANKKDILRKISQSIENSYAQYDTAKQKLALSTERIVLNRKLLDAYKSQYEGARISLLALMRAESQLFNARLEEIENRYGLLLSEFYLLSSSGRLGSILLGEYLQETHQ